MPIFCLNDPSVFDLPKKKEVNREALTGKAINVREINQDFDKLISVIGEI